MSIVVMKFGGSSVANTEKIFRAARIAVDSYNEGNDVVMVVSAQGDTTDELIAQAGEIDSNPSRREMDMLLSSGEQVSAALMAMAINKLGSRAVSLTGWQAGFLTDSVHSFARIRRIEGSRIFEELGKRNIVVVAGFQGISRSEDITTLGRGGSDTSAVAIAASLHADVCRIYTDVDGVFTADPRKVKGAKKIDEISFDEMLELSTLGAQVLLNRSVELAKKYQVNLEVRSSKTDLPGTLVKERTSVEGMIIKGVTKDTNIAAISIMGVPDRPGVAFRIFSLLAQKKISTDMILQSVGENATQDITTTIPLAQLDTALEILNQNLSALGASGVNVEKNVAKVSAVGAGLQSDAEVISRIFGALFEARINIMMISTSEIKMSVLLKEEDADRAVEAIHNEFIV